MSDELKQRVQREAKRLMDAGVAGQAFPGGVACVGWMEGDQPHYVEVAAGRLRADEAAVKPNTPYDLASLTKPVVATAALRLVAAGKLALDARTDTIVTDVRGGVGGAATLEKLLRHEAGLAPWGGLYLDVPHDPGTPAARRWILSEASRRPNEEPGAGPHYSDLGYLIAGEVIARSAGDKLDKVVSREVCEPLGIAHEVYYAAALPPDRRAQVIREAAPTEWCEWRGRLVRGEVHDENCAAFGGVAGSAGLFGTAHGVAVFGRAVLDSLLGRTEFLPRHLIERALEPSDRGSTVRMGWDQKSPEGSSAGRRMGSRTFGHLGFTGTSLWCDPDSDVVIVLLTNRVHPSRANERIKGFRPGFHDGVMSVLGK
ncbi:MAG: serine hydrolase [Myxococcales bacterium]|nr:serine hydrolase [Myxococcales bacterium]